MRSPFDAKTLIGSLALLVTFVLALPGVEAVRADDQAAPLASGDGPTCNPVGREAGVTQADSAADAIRREIAAQVDPSQAAQIIVLNNRGYNYGPANSLERSTLDVERLRAEH